VPTGATVGILRPGAGRPRGDDPIALGKIELTNNRRERELRRLVIGRKNWLFTWLDGGGKRTAAILSIIASCISHEVDPRAYLHRVTSMLVRGWPNAKLRELLPDRILAAHPDLFAGERLEPPEPNAAANSS
jgi:hypothetical protein